MSSGNVTPVLLASLMQTRKKEKKRKKGFLSVAVES